jgi:hypothetical protein
MSDEKKNIIDEDWKAQVQAEKDAAAKCQPNASPQPSTSEAAAGADETPQMPPASLEMLITMLATEAMVSLGQIQHPATGQFQADRGQAQYLIDLLGVLRDKTKGNLTSREDQLLEMVLHDLRLAFVQTIGPTPPGPSPDHLA